MTGYRLAAHELAVLDEDPEASEAEPERAEADPEPEPVASTALAPPVDDRDLAYTVRLIDAALLRIDAVADLTGTERSFPELIAIRDRARDR